MTIVVGSSPAAKPSRYYTWQGVRLPSVTSIPKMAGLSEGLHRYFVGNLIDHVLAHASDISLRIATGDERELKLLRAALWKAIDGDDTARVVGLAVHRAAALGQRPEEVEPSIAPKLAQYLDWRAQSGAEVLASEFTVYHLAEGYAGTGDLLVRFGDGSVWLVDLKSGARLYVENVLQLTAYLMAEFAGADDVVDERVTALLGQVAGVGILHLGEAGWEFLSIRADKLPVLWTAYRGLIRYVGVLQSGFDGLVDARRWSDGRTTDLVAAAIDAGAVDTYGQLGWRWARIGDNLAHLVPPHGDTALCLRAVERGRRTELETEPERVCARCRTTREGGQAA